MGNRPVDWEKSGFLARCKNALYLALRRTVYPYFKWYYHRLYTANVKRFISTYGEKAMVIRHFVKTHDHPPDLENPTTFSEKLAWMKLYMRSPLMVQCADKYRVRQYVQEMVGEKYLIPLHGAYKEPSEIPFDALPAPYVLKVNHASGGNCFCFDKSSFDEERAVRVLNHHLMINAYYFGCEWAYRDIQPMIVCEQILFDEKNQVPSDYKIFCFNGKPLLIQVDIDRFIEHRRNYYDTDWNLLPTRLIYENAVEEIPRPGTLEEMLVVAEKLSHPFDFARIDLYSVRGNVYFGEITFYPEGGAASFAPAEHEILYGNMIRLTKPSVIDTGVAR